MGNVQMLLRQHVGAPCAPCVEVGAEVKKGTLIATPTGLGANIFSSVYGKVTEITEDRIIIEPDAEQPDEFIPVTESVEGITDESSKLDLVKAAGIVGMGGAGFPTNVKVTPKNEEEIDYVIVNGAECEPYLTSDYRRMIEEPEKVIGGLKIMLHMFPRAKGVICIEDNKPDCIVKFRELLLPEDNIEVLELKTKYPQGAERMLIYAATGRKVNSSMLPADAGCIVDNIDTVTAIYQAVRFGEPLMSRIVTVTGDAVQNPCNFEVPVGMLLSELLEQAGGLKNEASKIICGGPMMGKALFTMEVPVTKTTSALTCLTEDEVSALAPSACINCGRCVSVCPGQILPARLSVFAEHGEEEKFLKYGGMECCECGCCSFICPARRPLTQEISSMRKVLLAKRKKK